MIRDILRQYEDKIRKMGVKKKTLILCHGLEHEQYKYLKFKESLLLDINEANKPNIVGDIRNSVFMKKQFPAGYFDIVIMVYCPIADPTNKMNDVLWKNIYRILKKDGHGELITNEIVGLYQMRHRNMKISSMIEKLNKHINKFGFEHVKYNGKNKLDYWKIPKKY